MNLRNIRSAAVVGVAASMMLLPSSIGGAPPAFADTAANPCGWATSAAPATFDHVVWIVFENKSYKTVLKKGWAPYITGLGNKCGIGTNMQALTPDTSDENYLGLTSGVMGCTQVDSDGNCTDEVPVTTNQGPDVWPQPQLSLFEQLGTDWREESESMPSNCYPKDYGTMFAVNHTPAAYYTRQAAAAECKNQDLPLSGEPDISAKFTLITPNKLDIMHRTNIPMTTEQKVQAGDNWLAGVMPGMLDSPEYQAGKTVIILTWDEANLSTNQVPFIVISPYTHPGTLSNTYFTHYSVLKATEQMLGITTYLGHAADPGTTSIRSAFNLGVG